MSKWLVVSLGLAVAVLGHVVVVGAAAVSRLELVRWVSQRLRGAEIAGALLNAPGRVMGTGHAVGTLGVLMTGLGLAALLAPLPPPLFALGVLALGVPATVLLAYAVARPVGRRWASGVVRRMAPIMEWLARRLDPILPAPPATPAQGMAAAMRAGASEDLFQRDELTVVSGVIAFTERPVREVMTPRTAIVAIAEGTPPAEIGRILAESGYSRLPIYRDSLDNIVGMIYAFDLLKVTPGGSVPVRPVSLIPASRRCADVLFELQRERRQFAVVLDEFGGTAGIATFEDLLEELVGEIFDEHDSSAGPDVGVGELVEVDGTMPAVDLSLRFGITLPGGSATVSGLLAKAAGRIPQAGERFLIVGLEFYVLASTPTRVERLVVRRGAAQTIPIDVGRIG